MSRSIWLGLARVAVVVAAFNLVGGGTALAAACTPPEHLVVQSSIGGADAPPIVQGTGSARVVVARAQYTVAGLVCLVHTLRAAHGDWKRVSLLFFTSEQAATWFDPAAVSISDAAPRDPTGSKTFQSELRAIYSLDEAKGESHLEILPLGFFTPVSLRTTINLPATMPLACDFALGRRCVLALAPISFAGEVWKSGSAGFVTLSAVVYPSGAVAGVEVIAAGAASGWEGRLVAASVANLMTWWLEPAAAEEPITVTYDYDFGGPLPTDSQSLQWAMPRIRVLREPSRQLARPR